VEKKELSFLQTVITAEIAGKKTAIHAYDKIIWTVRSGFLTLVLAGWSLVIKAAVESVREIKAMNPYLLILCAFSLTLALGGYLIDRNYVRRKFRVIVAVNQLLCSSSSPGFDAERSDLSDLLKISGDADNKTYISAAYRNEITVSRILYSAPSMLITFIFLYILIKF